MSRSPTATRSTLSIAAAVLALLSSPGAASRGTALATSTGVWLGAASGQPQARAAEAGKKYWQQRYRDLKKRVASLTEELEQARAIYSRKRHDRRLRGETRTELLEKIQDLEKQLAQAERELEEFPEKARQAGALPGWFRDL